MNTLNLNSKSDREEEPTQLRGYQHKGWNQVREGAQKDYIKRSFQASISKNLYERKGDNSVRIKGLRKNSSNTHHHFRPMRERKRGTQILEDLLLPPYGCAHYPKL